MRGKRKLPFPALACLVLALPASAWSQAPASGSASPEAARVLRIAEFKGEGILSGEASALQSLITSYVVELKMFRVIDATGQELALREAETAFQLGATKEIAPLAADYILSSRTEMIGSLYVFTMDVTKAPTGEKKSVSDTFSSENDLLLSVRRMTRSLFEKPDSPSSAAAGANDRSTPKPASNAAPSLSLLSGTWKGDKNVDRVTMLSNGRGFAVLASGVRMSLKATIEGSRVIIAQDQPNSPDFYRPGPDLKSARIVAQGARPWRWIFSLSADGNSLTGTKESVFVTVSDKGVVTLDNNYVRDAVWTKLYR
jgi:hypothetical protein